MLYLRSQFNGVVVAAENFLVMSFFFAQKLAANLTFHKFYHFTIKVNELMVLKVKPELCL